MLIVRQHISTFLIDSKIVTKTAWGKAYKYTVRVGTTQTQTQTQRTLDVQNNIPVDEPAAPFPVPAFPVHLFRKSREAG